MNQEKLKKEYIPPKIEFQYVEMEEGIATGSAKVIAPDENGVIIDEWEKGSNTDRSFDW
ncbi:hypothetical protein [Elizabethkingia anophelis]|nr:hypothetical protein [Elizabethkingia anophelis]